MDLYGLLGYPLGHSFSARYFSEKFACGGIDAQYRNFEYASVQEALDEMLTWTGLKGFNVTIPFKEKIIPFLQHLSPEAEQIGAVNVVKVQRDSGGHPLLYGYNSDVLGFTQSIRPLLRPEHGHQALVLGTGGASKAVVHGLHQLGIDTRYVSRSGLQQGLRYEELTPEILSQYRIIVNCTPLGMYPQVASLPDIPYEALTSGHLLFDLVYNPGQTAFLKAGMEQGALTCNGLEMLHLQAEAAWKIWNE